MKKILLTLGITLFCSAASAQNSAIYKAQALDQKNDYQGAISVLEEAVANPKTTKLAEMYRMLGEDYAKLFNPQLLNAANSMPFDTTLFVTYLDKMIDNYTKSHNADFTPDKKGNVKPRFEILNKLRMLSFVDYYNYAAMFLYQNKNIDGAVTYFEKYLDYPYNPSFTEAERDSILTVKKTAYSQTALNLASLNYQKENWEKAIKYADIALKDTLGTRDLYVIKSQSYASMGDSASWLNTLIDAVKRTENPGFIQNLLYYYVSHNDVAGAEKMADELVATAPNSRASWYMKGCVDLNLKKDYPAARENFQKSLSIDPDYLEANINCAYTYVNQVISERVAGKFKILGSGKNVTKAQMPTYQKELAYAKSFYENAKPYMEKARSLAPDQPRLWAYALQMIYENLQMKTEKAEIDAIIDGM